jgi:Tfp pilus assembly protein PilX
LTAGAGGYFSTPLALGSETAFWTGGEGAAISATDCPFLAPATTFNWKSCSASVGTIYARNYQAAQYVVEMLSAFDDAGAVISLPALPVTASNYKYNFRVTTRSTGGSGGAEVILQTIYPHVNP